MTGSAPAPPASRSRAVRAGLSVGLALLVAFVAFVAAGTAVAARKPPGAPPSSAAFELSGAVEGLYPTVGAQLAVKIENPYAFPISVGTLEVAVGDAGPGCDGSDLVIEQVPLPQLVPANGELTITVAASLTDDVADACQGATWPLSYTATASKT